MKKICLSLVYILSSNICLASDNCSFIKQNINANTIRTWTQELQTEVNSILSMDWRKDNLIKELENKVNIQIEQLLGSSLYDDINEYYNTLNSVIQKVKSCSLNCNTRTMRMKLYDHMQQSCSNNIDQVLKTWSQEK